MGDDKGCENCEARAVTGSTLCQDCLPISQAIFKDFNDYPRRENDSLISAMKDAIEARDKIIDDLIKDGIKKDHKIDLLKEQAEFVSKWAKWIPEEIKERKFKK